MAEVLIQNMRDPSQQVTLVVTLRRTIVHEVDPRDPVWVLEANTLEEDEDGDPIAASRIYLSDHDTLTEDINGLISDLCKKINWTYVPDTDPPAVAGHWPARGASGIEVTTGIIINLTEVPPSSGIDLSSIHLKVKGFDLTDQLDIKGDFRDCSIRVTPGTKFKSALKQVK